jgi:hypothetical protein
MEFQGFIANIALLVLVLTLVIIAVILYRSKNKFVAGNVVIGECPDYWTMNLEGNVNYCNNVKNLGKTTCSRKMNFTIPPWSSNDGVCKKYNWAKQCDLTWDGITNNPNACKKK